MDYVEGRVFSDDKLPSMKPQERAAVYDHLNYILAEFHKIDFEAVGLSRHGNRGNYAARQLRTWGGSFGSVHRLFAIWSKNTKMPR